MSQARFAIALVFVLVVGMTGIALAQQPATKGPTLVLDTAKGTIEIELFQSDAPKSVARILTLVRQHFYRGQRFHWVETGVVQFGDPFSRDMTKVDNWGNGGTGRTIGVAEISKRKFDRGIVGYAYRPGQKPTAADSQMFILTRPNTNLDGKYVAIGRVTRGMDVVEKLQKSDMIKLATIK